MGFAKILGDTTAEDMGRLTINPIKHIDLIGTVILPLTMFFLSGFVLVKVRNLFLVSRV